MFRFYVHYKNNIAKNEAPDPCADPENFVRGGSNSDNVFFCILVCRKRIQIRLKLGHHWPTGETSFKWRFAGVPMMTQH